MSSLSASERRSRNNAYLNNAVDRLPLRLRLRGRVARVVDLWQVPSPSGEGAHVPLLSCGPEAKEKVVEITQWFTTAAMFFGWPK